MCRLGTLSLSAAHQKKKFWENNQNYLGSGTLSDPRRISNPTNWSFWDILEDILDPALIFSWKSYSEFKSGKF